MTEDDYQSNRQKVTEAIDIIARASADADAAAHQPGKNDAQVLHSLTLMADQFDGGRSTRPTAMSRLPMLRHAFCGLPAACKCRHIRMD